MFNPSVTLGFYSLRHLRLRHLRLQLNNLVEFEVKLSVSPTPTSTCPHGYPFVLAVFRQPEILVDRLLNLFVG